MEVFFSGTDMEELEENSASHDFYLSLIVNNWMDFKARIAFRGSIDTEVPAAYKALDETGEAYTLSKSQIRIKEEKLFIYDCEIKAPTEKEFSLDETFCNNVTEIIEKAKVEEEEKKKASQYYSNPYGTNYLQGHSYYPPFDSKLWYPDNNTPPISPIRTQVETKSNQVNERPTDIARDIVKDIPFDKLEESEKDDSDYDEFSPEIVDFVIALLANAYPYSVKVEVSSITEILDVLDIISKDSELEDLSKNILTNYPVIFEKYFEDSVDDPDVFIEVTGEVIDLLGKYENIYNFLTPVIEALEFMIDKYEEHVSTI